MISINTNNGGLFAAKAASQSQATIDSAMQRLSTGSRINNAKDDAAGQAIATRLTAEIQGLEIASRNVADGQSLVDTAEGALQETHTLLLRMREIGVQAANGTLSTSDNEALDAEFQQLIEEVDRIAGNTTFAGQELLDGTYSSVNFQVGTGAGEVITVSIAGASSSDIGTTTGSAAVADLNSAVINTAADADAAIASVDKALEEISTARGSLGAVSNRLGSTMSNLDQIAVNLTSSQGRIADADFAQETGNLAKNQILQQAATAMIAQANASKSTILTLVRG